MVSDQPPNNTMKHNTGRPGGSTFVVSREAFDAIPGYRGRYIMLYLLITLLLIAPKAVFVVTRVDPPYEFAPIYYALLITAALPFYYYFFRAMRTLGYPFLQIILTLMVTSTPILGLLPMGFMDRKIADAWDKADDAHQKYRQHVFEDEENEDKEDEDPEQSE